jgi:hypothetical protein
MPTVAERQLAAWQAIAADWPVSHDAQHGRDTAMSAHNRAWRCGDCQKGVALAYDDSGRRYQYTDEQWLALIVLHLRNHHPDLDPGI